MNPQFSFFYSATKNLLLGLGELVFLIKVWISFLLCPAVFADRALNDSRRPRLALKLLLELGYEFCM